MTLTLTLTRTQMLMTEVAVKKMNSTQDRATQHLALEKELTLLTSLTHPNVLRCLGVVLQPLGAVLELAPNGSLRSVYLEYARLGQVIPAPIIHKTLLDVRQECSTERLRTCGLARGGIVVQASEIRSFLTLLG